MKCKICGYNEVTPDDPICDSCKASIIINPDIPPNLEDFECF